MSIQRRTFIRNLSLTLAGSLALRPPLTAGALPAGKAFQRGVLLDPAQVRQLYQRGAVTTYLKSRNELQFIGMPVGGIHCGTLYLGGDGRLWLWDIFNRNQEGIEPKTIPWDAGVLNKGKKVGSRDGACYIEPSRDIRPLDQGFAVQLEFEGQTLIRRLDAGDWPEIAFDATYPAAVVRYIDPQLPVTITLEAFSPFIPLNEDDSGLPVTVFSFDIRNTGKQPVSVTLLGWLENKAGLYSADGAQERVNTLVAGEGWRGVQAGLRSGQGTASADKQPDHGDLCIAAFHPHSFTRAAMEEGALSAAHFKPATTKEVVKGIAEKLTGAVGSTHRMEPGATAHSDFTISWYFPNLHFEGIEGTGRYYANRFGSSVAVTGYVHEHFARLAGQTRLWKHTWYDSSLPWWFLERSFVNISTLATTTCHRFLSGRFYAWEGVGACPGTCTHVWQYAQAVGRIFPALERDTRERVDLGLSLQPDGGIWFRGEAEKRPAIDGQAGTLLRIYREHQMSADNVFLQKNWPRIKKAARFVIEQDRNGDGMEDTPMENTLDAVWDGEIAWIVGLCIAAVKAAGLMAREMSDTAFAAECEAYVTRGRRNMETELFNGEYFIHRPDAAKGRTRLGSYNTCHIDQVYGQSWAFQAGMGRVLDKEKTVSALRALWQYNFMKDVGPYIQTHTGGRPYALPGEGGMVMNTNPRNEAHPYGEDSAAWQLGYFHECMTGFEHQVASHMMAEGMTDEALLLTRAVHDRYHAARRNPFNEIECSDHYARAMASYGTFITACGFEYHGPKGYIRFAPAWDAAQFRAAFVTARGWGAYRQQRGSHDQLHELSVKYGSLSLRTLRFETAEAMKAARVTVTLSGKQLPAAFTQEGKAVTVTLAAEAHIPANGVLQVRIS